MRDRDKKKNCWEFMKCGREPGGVNAMELGVCRAATEAQVNGLNNGKNAGRVCWAVTGTLCGGHVQGSFAGKISSCKVCDFYKLVHMEEELPVKTVKNIREQRVSSKDSE